MNVKLLRKVKKHILEEPKRLDMDVLLRHVEGDGAPACKTGGCIAGWCLGVHYGKRLEFNPELFRFLLDGVQVDIDKDAPLNFWRHAQGLLALTETQAERLFNQPKFYKEDDEAWPAKFAIRYLRATTPRGRANATADRIEHFIKTKGRE